MEGKSHGCIAWLSNACRAQPGVMAKFSSRGAKLWRFSRVLTGSSQNKRVQMLRTRLAALLVKGIRSGRIADDLRALDELGAS